MNEYFIEWSDSDAYEIQWFYLSVPELDDVYEIEFVDDPVDIEFEMPRTL